MYFQCDVLIVYLLLLFNCCCCCLLFCLDLVYICFCLFVFDYVITEITSRIWFLHVVAVVYQVQY